MIVNKNISKYVIMFFLCLGTTIQNDIKATNNSQTDLEAVGVLMLGLGGFLYTKFKDSFSELGEAAQNAFKKNVLDTVKGKYPKAMHVIDNAISKIKNKPENSKPKNNNNNLSPEEQAEADLQKALAESIKSLEEEHVIHLQQDAIPSIQTIIQDEIDKNKDIQNNSEVKKDLTKIINQAAQDKDTLLNDNIENNTTEKNNRDALLEQIRNPALKLKKTETKEKDNLSLTTAKENYRKDAEMDKKYLQEKALQDEIKPDPIDELYRPFNASDLLPSKSSNLLAPSLGLQPPTLSSSPAKLSSSDKLAVQGDNGEERNALLDQIRNPGFKLKKIATKEKNGIINVKDEKKDNPQDNNNTKPHQEILHEQVKARYKALHKKEEPAKRTANTQVIGGSDDDEDEEEEDHDNVHNAKNNAQKNNAPENKQKVEKSSPLQAPPLPLSKPVLSDGPKETDKTAPLDQIKNPGFTLKKTETKEKGGLNSTAAKENKKAVNNPPADATKNLVNHVVIKSLKKEYEKHYNEDGELEDDHEKDGYSKILKGINNKDSQKATWEAFKNDKTMVPVHKNELDGLKMFE